MTASARSAALAGALTLLSGLLPGCAGAARDRGSKREAGTLMEARNEAAPRKVIVATTVFPMYGEYPGLDARLDALGKLVDAMGAEAARKFDGAGLDLAVLPENAVTQGRQGRAARRALPLEGKVLDAMGAVARRNKTYLVVPMAYVEDADKGVYHNAAALLDRAGKLVGVYRKVHLVVIEDTGELERGLTPGRDFPVFDCDFGRVGIQICFDIGYDDGWETLARKGAEIVAWPSASPQTIQPATRARLQGYHIVSATPRNNASVFDPTGHVIAQTKEPNSVVVERIDLSYVLLDWQRKLNDGKIFTDKYGRRVGYRYSRAEDGGIFWSNDPDTPVMRMVRELGLELPAEKRERSRALQDKARGRPPSLK